MKKGGLGRRGFTLIEVIVVAAIIAILAAILVPMIFNQIDESKITKAKGDVSSIKTAIAMFRKDTGKWPVYNANPADVANATVVMLNSQGGSPDWGTTTGWNVTSVGMNNQLINNQNADGTVTKLYEKWKGPYFTAIPTDPWDREYLVNVGNFSTPAAPVWVISAGPDGKMCTNTDATEIAADCDDIGIRIQ